MLQKYSSRTKHDRLVQICLPMHLDMFEQTPQSLVGRDSQNSALVE